MTVGAVVDAEAVHVRRAAERAFQDQASLAAADAAHTRAQVVLYSENRVSPGKTFTDSLKMYGVEPAAIAAIVGSAQPVYDLRHVRAGNRLFIGRSVTGELRGLRYQIDPGKMLDVKSAGPGFAAAISEIPSRTQAETISGQIRDSLFNAVADAGESPELAYRLAQIFGYDLDFYTDPRHGDTFRVVVEKTKYLDGKTAGYGRILAAEYDNDGHPYQALLFHDPAGNPAYYSPDGKSLQKAFLRSPLKFAAPITSHFSLSRFHPILKTYRPHLGIDYGAPTGTPVQTIGAGRVVFAGRKGGDGNMVHIAHSNGYETMYLHLSRILVRAGARVQLGQTIGLVGMTGLATGPHLDFRILQHGEFRNFLALHLPPSDPVARRDWDSFASLRDQWVPLLTAAPEAHTAMAQPAESSPALMSTGSR
ncbi:MAG: peptidoglycan DD-metalloendopeptidase family protein [Acidobacteriia bacterium]|nr:peptidoglycan DD-metalloendopeptidase family protein [Terriglobia bacterium]